MPNFFLQVVQDLHDIWDWVLTQKLHLPPRDRNLYAAIIVLPESFDNRGMLSDCIFSLLLDNVDDMFKVFQKDQASVVWVLIFGPECMDLIPPLSSL